MSRSANDILKEITDPGCDITEVNPIKNMPFKESTQNITHINPNTVVANKTMGELLDSSILYTAYGGYYLKDGDNFSSKDVAVNIRIGNMLAMKTAGKPAIRGFFLAADSKFVYLCKSHKVIDHVINMVMFPSANVAVSRGKDSLSGAVISSCGGHVIAIPYASAALKVLKDVRYKWGEKRESLLKNREEAIGYHDNNYLPAVQDPVLKEKGSVVSQQAAFKPNPAMIAESNQQIQPAVSDTIPALAAEEDIPDNTTQNTTQEEPPMAQDRLTTLKAQAIEKMASDPEKASSILLAFADQNSKDGGNEELVKQMAKLILGKSPSKEDKAAMQEAVFDNI